MQAQHGVRVGYGFGGMGSAIGLGADQALNIYTVRISLPELRDLNRAELSDEAAMERWTVQHNIIPSLQFRAVNSPL